MGYAPYIKSIHSHEGNPKKLRGVAYHYDDQDHGLQLFLRWSRWFFLNFVAVLLAKELKMINI